MHMRSFMKIKPSRNDEITLSFTDMGKFCHCHEFLVANMSLNPIRENKILAKKFRIYSIRKEPKHLGWKRREKGVIKIRDENRIFSKKKKRGIPVKKEETPYTPFKMQQI